MGERGASSSFDQAKIQLQGKDSSQVRRKIRAATTAARIATPPTKSRLNQITRNPKADSIR